jgi:hypothetical protein
MQNKAKKGAVNVNFTSKPSLLYKQATPLLIILVKNPFFARKNQLEN